MRDKESKNTANHIADSYLYAHRHIRTYHIPVLFKPESVIKDPEQEQIDWIENQGVENVIY